MTRVRSKSIVRPGIAVLAAAALGLAASAVPLGSVPAPAHATSKVAHDVRPPGPKRLFHDQMRNLWEQHVFWTRLFIVSDVNNLPDLQATTDRLLQNQVDIGNAFRPYYGDAAAEQLASLLREHILLAAQVLNAAKAGDDTALQQALRDWYANADQIAMFLHDLQPHAWSFEALQQMMKEHLDLTLTEAVDYLHGDYAKSVEDFDAVEAEALTMADALSSGIIRTHHDQFTSMPAD